MTKAKQTSEYIWDEAAFSKNLADIKARRDEFRDQRHISQDVIETWQALGLYGSFVPTCLGGYNVSVGDFLRRVERISEADGSSGWVASFAFASKYLQSLPRETLEEIYADDPNVVFAGAVFPPKPAKRVDGGVRVSGRWGFGSGCMGASLIGVGVALKDGDKSGLPLMAVMPADKVRIEQTWDTLGMTATGSHDMIVEDVFVPDNYLLVRGAPPSIDEAGFRYPSLAIATQVLAITSAGLARAAINHIVEIAHKSKSITGAPTLGDRQNVQIHLAECEAKLEAARSWFYDRINVAWGCVEKSEPVSRELNMQLRLSSSHLARMGAEITRACIEMSGTMGIFNDNPLSRYFTDAMVTAQHAFLGEGTFMNAGRVMVGHDIMPGYDEISIDN